MGNGLKRIQSKEHVIDIGEKLEERYENLKEKLNGEELTNREKEIYKDSFDSEKVKIEPRELRLAIDAFSSILKEIKQICK